MTVHRNVRRRLSLAARRPADHRALLAASTIARIALRRCSGSVGQASITAARSGSAMASELVAIRPVGGVWGAVLALLRAALCAAVLAFDFTTLAFLETISEPHFRWYGRLARTLHHGATFALRGVCTGETPVPPVLR